MDPMEELKQTFFQECEELLIELETGLQAIDDDGADDETINAVFRAVHSIKGGAGAFAMDDLVKFAHKFETTLDEVRAGRLAASADVLKVLLRSTDLLSDLVRAAREGDGVDDARVTTLLSELAALTGTGSEAAVENPESESDGSDDDIGFAPLKLDFDMDDDDEGHAARRFVIHFAPKAEMYANANEAALLLRDLQRLGEVAVECDTSTVPSLDDLDPEGAYLSWTITLESEEPEPAIREVFDFVDGDCVLEITEEHPEPSVIEAEPAGDERAPIDSDIAIFEEPSPDAAPANGKPKTVEGQSDETPASSAAKSTIRVDLDRVDRLINLVGELVINQAMLTQNVYDSGVACAPGVDTGLEELKLLTRDLQESVMAIRAQPVRTLFQRMSRIVREAGDATEKAVRLVTEGEMTEVDKTVIERLADPLTHMIRNSVDHGIEAPEERAAAGKPAEGTVRLTAAHRSGRVLIQIIDDGAGINRERVKTKAIEKDLIAEDANLSDSEIDNLIFHPGFSTAASVSSLSGRGVGMDVVKRAIQALGGKISISSTPGEGSVFTVSLPLTLAILDGMVVEVAGETIVVPLTAIVETLKPAASEIHEMGPDGRVISIRGEFTPLVDVGQVMGYRDSFLDPTEGVVLSVLTDDGARSAMVVDGIQDQRQVVIKSLEENYGTVAGVAAATILGDGRIALILDVDGILAQTDGTQTSQEPALAAVG